MHKKYFNFHRQVEETGKVEGQVMDLAAEVDRHANEVDQVLRQKTAVESQLEHTTSIIDSIKTENFMVRTKLRNVKVIRKEKKSNLSFVELTFSCQKSFYNM